MDDDQLPLPIEPSAMEAVLPTAPDYRRKKRQILLTIIAAAFLIGIVIVILALSGFESIGLNAGVQIPITANILRWCLVDAKEREHFVGKIMRFSIVIFTPIAFAIYVFRTRGIAGFKTLVLAILFYALVMVCIMLGGLAAIFAIASTGLVAIDL